MGWKGTMVMLGMSLLLLSSCMGKPFQDNQVYIVENGNEQQAESVVDWLDLRGENPFQEETIDVALADGQFLLTVDQEGIYCYYGEYTETWDIQVLRGLPAPLIDIYRLDKVTGLTEQIAQQVPFISKVQWNNTGDMIAFSGSGVLLIYDCTEERMLLGQELQNEFVTDFFWSPLENNKLYIEQPESTAGRVYYVDPQKKAELYETTEKLYYKAKVDEQYYYATQWRNNQEEQEAVYTVLTDGQKQIVKVVGQGSYKDHYRQQVLLNGENHFSLTYIADINQINQRQILTEEYIYDAKFIAGGRVLYVTADQNTVENQYLAHIVSARGEELAELTISGNAVLLDETGTKGYVSGPGQEELDLVALRITNQQIAENASVDGLRQAAQGAADLYCRVMLGQKVSDEEIQRYFANGERIGQLNGQNEEKTIAYSYSARLTHLEQYDEQEAVAVVMLQGFTREYQYLEVNMVCDLIKKNNRWYVLDFATGEQNE